MIAGGYPQDGTSLKGIFAFDQAIALKAKGYQVVYISIDLRSFRRRRKIGITNVHQRGIEIFNISIPLGSLPWRILYIIGGFALNILYKIVAKKYGKPNILHAHFTMIGAIAARLKHQTGIPLVITEHSSQMNIDKLTSKSLSVGKIAFESADAIVSVSSILKSRIQNNFGKESIVIPNIVDVFNFSLKSSKKESSQRFQFISVGNLVSGKGFDSLVEAFHHSGLQKRASLSIIGSGPICGQLESQIKQLHLEDSVKLLGFKSRSEIATLMQTSDCFVLASRGETFGVVYIEALASGLPVIATNCGGPEDFIDKSNGLLVTVDDRDQISSALTFMFENIDYYNSEEISKNCIRRFSPDLIAHQLHGVYMSIVQSKNKR